jgi:hypothetical protein
VASSKNEITPERAKALIKAIKANPNLTDAADICGVHPRTLAAAIKRGLFPNPDPQDAALARAARHSRALLRGDLFDVVKNAALGKLPDAKNKGEMLPPDTKLAMWLIERLTDEGELTWSETLPGPHDAPQIRQALFARPTPELLQDVHAAGMKLVPLTSEERLLPAPAVDGELMDDDE